jgi:phenylacetic acid degradation operon negative regulatory protein
VGASARLLCRNLYRRLLGPAEHYLSKALVTADGPLPDAAPDFYDRFGGLVETQPPSATN